MKVDFKKRFMQAKLTDSVKKTGKDMYDLSCRSSGLPLASAAVKTLGSMNLKTFKLISLLHL